MSYSKIKSITKHHSDIPIPVYDISVKKNHNFAVDGSLIVHNCLPYQFFKNVIYEKRIEMYDSNLLTEEIIGLERNNNTGKVDHTPLGGGINSKDQSDAVCGSLYAASKHIEEFNFEFGETLDTIVDVSASGLSPQAQKQQVILDFEEELKRAKINDDSHFMDFGFGKRGDLNIDNYLMNGIII